MFAGIIYTYYPFYTIHPHSYRFQMTLPQWTTPGQTILPQHLQAPTNTRRKFVHGALALFIKENEKIAQDELKSRTTSQEVFHQKDVLLFLILVL